jgi:hypothetical protein
LAETLADLVAEELPWLHSDLRSDALMCLTAFPAGCDEIWRRQLKRVNEIGWHAAHAEVERELDRWCSASPKSRIYRFFWHLRRRFGLVEDPSQCSHPDESGLDE